MRSTKTQLTSDLEKMHIQWFADPDDMEFVDEEDDDDAEVVILRPGEEPPEEEEPVDDEKEDLKRQIAELSNRANDPSATGKAIADSLSQVLNRPVNQQETQQPQQQPGESEEEFAARFAKQVWKPGEEYKAIKDAILRIVGPAYQQTIGATVKQSKKLIAADPEKGPLFRKYEKQIEEERRKMPWHQQNDPEVYEQLYERVVAQNPEVQQEQISLKVQEQVAQVLKEQYGIDPSSPRGTSKPTFTEAGGTRGGAPKKKRVYVTEDDRRMAIAKGMDVKEYVRWKQGGR